MHRLVPCLLLVCSVMIAQTIVNRDVIPKTLDASGATTFVPPFVTTIPSGSCTTKGDQRTYLTAGTPSIYTCTPTTGTVCPCAWVKSSGGTPGPQGATGATGPAGNADNTFAVSFLGQSSQTVSATTTKVSDRAYIRVCYDTTVSPAAWTMPFNTTLNQTTYALTVDMGSSFNGYCIGGENAAGGTRVNFTAQTSVTVAASTHGLADKATVRGCNDSTGAATFPYNVTLNQSTYALTIDMGSSFTGYCLVQ